MDKGTISDKSHGDSIMRQISSDINYPSCNNHKYSGHCVGTEVSLVMKSFPHAAESEVSCNCPCPRVDGKSGKPVSESPLYFVNSVQTEISWWTASEKQLSRMTEKIAPLPIFV